MTEIELTGKNVNSMPVSEWQSKLLQSFTQSTFPNAEYSDHKSPRRHAPRNRLADKSNPEEWVLALLEPETLKSLEEWRKTNRESA